MLKQVKKQATPHKERQEIQQVGDQEDLQHG